MCLCFVNSCWDSNSNDVKLDYLVMDGNSSSYSYENGTIICEADSRLFDYLTGRLFYNINYISYDYY